MNAIHIIMSTSTSANPHNVPNERIENIVRKRRISAITFFLFGLLLIISGSLLVSFDSQRFSVSFILFGIIGILFAFVYWMSAERILIALRKINAQRMRQLQAQHADGSNVENINLGDVQEFINSIRPGLPSYEQSVVPRSEIPPPYNEAIKLKSSDNVPINSISLSVDQLTRTNSISEENSSPKQSSSQ